MKEYLRSSRAISRRNPQVSLAINSVILSLIALAFLSPLENILQFSNACLIDTSVVFLIVLLEALFAAAAPSYCNTLSWRWQLLEQLIRFVVQKLPDFFSFFSVPLRTLAEHLANCNCVALMLVACCTCSSTPPRPSLPCLLCVGGG